MKNNRHNCRIILEHDPILKGAFRKNILTGQTDIVKPLWWEKVSPALDDMDMNYVMLYLEETYGLTMDKIVEKSIDVSLPFLAGIASMNFLLRCSTIGIR